MFNQSAGARRGPGSMQPPVQSQCEVQAKEKLATFIYEYLLLSGAQKSAETFKDEVFNNLPNASCYKPSESGPGFLQNWWMLFWDLYCAAPERRENSAEPTQDGKMFYDIFMQGGGAYGPGGPGGPGPMMNGMPGMFPGGPMGIPGPDGMMTGPMFAGRFPGGRGGPPTGMPAGYGMFPPNDPRAVAGQRMQQSNAMRMPSTSFAGGPGMRQAGVPPQGMGGFRGPPSFMDSPGQAFPPGAMMPNGGMGSAAAAVPMSMASPGMAPAPGGPEAMGGANSFMMTSAGMPPSSTAVSFMGDAGPSMSMGNGMPPSSMSGETGSLNMATPNNNGEEVKQSPASTPHGANNGGTPAPGSVQSGSGSVNPSGGNGEEKPNGTNNKGEDMDEISKIKQGLMDDFTPKGEAPEQTGAGGFF